MTLQVVPLTPEHVPDAAALMGRRYRRLRRTDPTASAVL